MRTFNAVDDDDDGGRAVTADNPADVPADFTTAADAADDRRQASALLFGMKWFIASLSMLFAAGVVAYVVTRLQAPPELWLPRTPTSLVFSTIILILSGATLHLGVKTFSRTGHSRRLFLGLSATFGLGCAFLAVQGVNWIEVSMQHRETLAQGLWGFLFFVLTALHAIHVIGGLIPLGIVTWRHATYTRANMAGVKAVALYWHFLGVVWLVLFVLVNIP